MKKALSLVFAFLLLLPTLAAADVIVEPENSFYRTHRDECRRMAGRTFLANGPDGVLNVYTAPGGTVSKTLKNGTAFYCQWIYTDKQEIVWGFSERHEAWAPLGYTMVQYDHIAFETDHQNEIVTEASQTLPLLSTVFLYEYPGAPNPIRLDSVDLTAQKLYTDEQGRQWGYVSYIYGIRNKWFCLDDPQNGDLGQEGKAPIPSGYAVPETLPSASTTGVILGVVGGVSLVTLGTVLVLFRRKKRAG